MKLSCDVCRMLGVYLKNYAMCNLKLDRLMVFK